MFPSLYNPSVLYIPCNLTVRFWESVRLRLEFLPGRLLHRWRFVLQSGHISCLFLCCHWSVGSGIIGPSVIDVCFSFSPHEFCCHGWSLSTPVISLGDVLIHSRIPPSFNGRLTTIKKTFPYSCLVSQEEPLAQWGQDKCFILSPYLPVFILMS